MKAGKKKILEFIKDEKAGAKEYHKYGFHNLEKDERKHKKFLQNRLKGM